MGLKIGIGQKYIYTSTIKKTESWMRDVQQWKIIFMLPVGDYVEHIQNLIGLNNISEQFVHVGTYIFEPQSYTIGFVVKDGPKYIAKFLPIGQFIVILRHPPNTSLEINFADGKGTLQGIQLYNIEPSNGWGMF